MNKSSTNLSRKLLYFVIKFIELEDKLNINSSNSNLSTCRDVYRIEKRNRPKSDKHPGGQIGHKYSGYKLKEPDQVIEVLPEETICQWVVRWF